MKKRILVCILTICILLSATANCFAADPYWAWLSKYEKAMQTNDINAIVSCAKEIKTIYAKPSTKDEYTRIANPNSRAARDCEKAGRFTEAKEFYKTCLDCYKWLHKNGVDQYDNILNITAILEHLEGYLDIYTVSSNPTDVPYYQAINEPQKGTYFGMCNFEEDEFYSSKLVYVSFFIEDISDYVRFFNSADTAEVIEVAWNVPNETKEDLEKILSGKWDSYIISNVKFLKNTGRKILLRFGAEVNCWEELPTNKADYEAYGKEYCKTYIAAFRYIADIVHLNAPNCAMVYSPNDISNRYFTIEDFYPGDKYVDWVGFSTYDTYSSGGELGNGGDAYYSTGMYDNQIIRIKNIVDTFGDRKPIMISECGFPYYSTSSTQNVTYAKNKLKYFYTYVNMVFPQVKAILYFNKNIGANSYKLTGSDGNSGMSDTYYSTIAQNPSMMASANPKGARYFTKLENYNQNSDNIKLYAFTYFPGNNNIKVTYTLSGGANATYSTTQYPYSYTLPKLEAGVYTLNVKSQCAKTVISKEITLCVNKYGKVTPCVNHKYKTAIAKATPTSNGRIVKRCSVCSKLAVNSVIRYVKTIKLSAISYTYDGKVKTPSVIVKDSAGKTLKKNTDYTVTYATGRKNVGTYKVAIKFKGYYSGAKVLTFKIYPAKLGSCKLSAISYAYDGKVKTPAVIVKNAGGVTLTKNVHYTVTYSSGRKNVGTYKVAIKGKGNYSGAKVLTFKIVPRAASINTMVARPKAIYVKLNRSLVQSTGYQVQYSTSKTFVGAKTKAITNYRTNALNITGLKANTYYFVRVRTYKKIGSLVYYSNWSTIKYIKTK